jgi:hypothetical protein
MREARPGERPRLAALAARDRATTAAMLAHLAEVDLRRWNHLPSRARVVPIAL